LVVEGGRRIRKAIHGERDRARFEIVRLSCKVFCRSHIHFVDLTERWSRGTNPVAEKKYVVGRSDISANLLA
jgi:hypothetical protein